METSRCKLSYGEVDSPHMGMRKIQPDPDLMSSLLNFSDEEDEEEEEESGDDREEEKVEKTFETDKTGESGERRSSWRKQCKSRTGGCTACPTCPTCPTCQPPSLSAIPSTWKWNFANIFAAVTLKIVAFWCEEFCNKLPTYILNIWYIVIF